MSANTDDYFPLTSPNVSIAPSPLMRTESTVVQSAFTEPTIHSAMSVAHNSSFARPMLMRSDSVAPPPLMRTESTVVQSAFLFEDNDNGSIPEFNMNEDSGKDQGFKHGLEKILNCECIHENAEFERIDPNGHIYRAGNMKFADESVYFGEWSHNRFRGEGTLIAGKKSRFVGRTYGGSWYMNDMMERSGSGKIAFTDGNIYTGIWVDGHRQCKIGKTVDSHGNISYNGMWHNDEQCQA